MTTIDSKILEHQHHRFEIDGDWAEGRTTDEQHELQMAEWGKEMAALISEREREDDADK